jgi:D-alanyl-D-alanine carboxypeptidase
MNKEAQNLGLKKSNFASAHGMYVEENYSTAHDMAKLCGVVMKDSNFKSIVRETYWECASHEYPGHIYKWNNTNFLLKQEPSCTGIKTGITWQAGPCLAAAMRRDGLHICVIILSCCSPESRWYEVPKLINWGVKKIQKIQASKLRPKMRRKLIKNFTYI